MLTLNRNLLSYLWPGDEKSDAAEPSDGHRYGESAFRARFLRQALNGLSGRRERGQDLHKRAHVGTLLPARRNEVSKADLKRNPITTLKNILNIKKKLH